MTEEVTYANLKFKNRHELDNIAAPEDTQEKGPATSSRSFWSVVLILFVLCLALLVAVVTLAVLFFQVPQDYRTQLRDLNMTKNELHANFSNMLQAIGNHLCLKGEKNLKNNGQNCVLCPANWKWEGGDICYYISKGKESWEESRQFCSSQNSTLFLIKNEEKLEMLKKIYTEYYWVGLIFRAEKKAWYWNDNTAITEKQKTWLNLQSPFSQHCGYFAYTNVYGTSCEKKYSYICEKPAVQLQRGNSHCQEDWFVRSK
ncbi:C-type lectin domain family 12 member A-like [Colius striatus]|uniref:C-type lectin domain family 12 member A-like n=1 Tax=Colius striatus TaxID=57412 RepID=UPI0005298754|nr:C-type lectin domain family 12 member A-like [Colius striatus]XP_061863668.1 C-type lectin domain family 12 member A-like [Colius striatus]